MANNFRLKAFGYNLIYPLNQLLRYQALSKFAFDLLWTGNDYLQIIKNLFEQIIRLRHLPALTMRYTDKRGVYTQLSNQSYEPIYFNTGEIIHVKEYDPGQGIYGISQYYDGIKSALLNEDATLFRRRYYKNGALMMTPLKNAIRDSKGVGNFRSLFLVFVVIKPMLRS